MSYNFIDQLCTLLVVSYQLSCYTGPLISCLQVMIMIKKAPLLLQLVGCIGLAISYRTVGQALPELILQMKTVNKRNSQVFQNICGKIKVL